MEETLKRILLVGFMTMTTEQGTIAAVSEVKSTHPEKGTKLEQKFFELFKLVMVLSCCLADWAKQRAKEG
jgi:hypothetical protein